MKLKTNMESMVNRLKDQGMTYSGIAEKLGLTYTEVQNLAVKNRKPKEKYSVGKYPDITLEFLDDYKRNLKIGKKVTVKNHLYEVERGGDNKTRKKMWVKAKIVAKYPHMVLLDNGHCVTYQELIHSDRYGRAKEED